MSDTNSIPIQVNLYVVGDQRPAQLQVEALKSIFAANNHSIEGIEIIDLLKQPLLASKNDILAIPTVIRISPEPSIRIIGDLSKDAVRVWALLTS